jgi:hypothetical protein
MGKHRVKNDPSPPKNDPSPPHRSDPSNEEYITVPKKVTFDSLVEFFPPQTQISPASRRLTPKLDVAHEFEIKYFSVLKCRVDFFSERDAARGSSKQD